MKSKANFTLAHDVDTSGVPVAFRSIRPLDKDPITYWASRGKNRFKYEEYSPIKTLGRFSARPGTSKLYFGKADDMVEL